MSPSDQSWTRRTYLRGAAATAGAVTAGCLEGLPPLGQRVRYGRIDAPGPLDAAPAYRRWIPAPTTVPDRTNGLDLEMYVHPGRMGRDTVGSNFAFGNSIIRAQMDYLGMDYESFERVLWLDGAFVFEGDIDRSLVGETLNRTGYTGAGGYREYDLLDRTDDPRLVAVGDGAVVFTRGTDRRVQAETVLDAGDGHVDRRHEVDGEFATFSERVGTYPFGWFGVGLTDPRSDAENSTLSVTFDADAAYYVYHLQYAPGEKPPDGKVRERIAENNRAIRSTGVDIESDERFVTVTMRIDGATFRERTRSHRTPTVTFGVEHDTDAGTLTIRHEGGDRIEPRRLRLEPAGAFEGQFDWAGVAVEPADSVTLNVTGTDASTVRIVYEYPDGQSTVTIFSYGLGDGGDSNAE